MGLDRWIKSEEIEKKKSPAKQIKKSKSKTKQDKPYVKKPKGLKKFSLECPNAKCKYQKIILKKELIDEDKICPRCNTLMKTKL